jgi:hypothetical protein
VLIDAAESPPIVAETRHAFVPAPEGKIADEAGGVKGPSKALSAYERKRNARIARNKMVLANLGLESTKAEMEQERAPKRRRVRTKPPRAKARDAPPPQRRQPSRRSSRVRGIAAAASASSGGPDPVSESESEPEPEPESFDDSDVLRYLASAPAAASCVAACAAPAPGATRRFVAPHAADVPHVEFTAESMKKIYSLHWWSPPSASTSAAPARGTLLCAAGEKGLVDVFGLDRDEPLASWKAHKGWIATARFVGADSGAAEGPRLLTAANDKKLTLWDLAKVSPSRRPRELCTATLHDQGVYCADTVGGRLCTSSKDGTVAFAALAPDAIRMTRRVELSRVVKVARFDREQPVVAAAAGNAGDVWVLDTRVAARGGVVLTLEVSVLLCTVIFYANLAHSLTRSP